MKTLMLSLRSIVNLSCVSRDCPRPNPSLQPNFLWCIHLWPKPHLIFRRQFNLELEVWQTSHWDLLMLLSRLDLLQWTATLLIPWILQMGLMNRLRLDLLRSASLSRLMKSWKNVDAVSWVSIQWCDIAKRPTLKLNFNNITYLPLNFFCTFV